MRIVKRAILTIVLLILVLMITFIIYRDMAVVPDFQPDIIVSPSGYYGVYNLGVCHYVKDHFNVNEKVVLGVSSGSFNAVLLTSSVPAQQMVDIFFGLNTSSLTTIAKNLCNCIRERYSIDDIDVSRLHIGICHRDEFTIHHNFLTIIDVLNCCMGSSFVPFITYSDLLYFYKHKLCIDAAVLFKKYLKKVNLEKTLLIRPSMFNRFIAKYMMTGLVKPKMDLKEMYQLGYDDAKKNHAYFLSYLDEL
jgi:hypothetical protein